MAAVVDFQMRGGWVIAASFLVAMMLSVLALPVSVPGVVGYLRPEWVVLVLIYWGIALPHRVGIVIAWFLGLAMDVLTGSLLGQHGIAYIIVAYIAVNLYQRLRMFSVWQQSLIVLVTVALSQMVLFWIERIAGLAVWSLWYMMPSVVSALLWPWVFLILRYLRRRFDVS